MKYTILNNILDSDNEDDDDDEDDEDIVIISDTRVLLIVIHLRTFHNFEVLFSFSLVYFNVFHERSKCISLYFTVFHG